MSSHHIIRDKQEPALIIANGEACSLELLEQLLEWSPTVIVLDGALERVVELGIKVDVWLGDFDRSFISGNNYDDYPLKKIHTPDQNKTDLEKAFDYLLEEGYPSVNVVWATGKRMDHTLNNFHSMAKYGRELKIVMIDDYSVSYLLPPVFEKWYPEGTSISLMPLAEAKQISSSGLLYELDRLDLCIGQRTGSSNVTKADGMVKISYESGQLLLMECHD
ncbi:thiamine diphosphokinase [Aquirufa aurantiipilula]|uniref:thiamine diphosphokinase n=1 Tax=Aquirufa aurantiipilula TaxID=2696561 RepID=UPI001CAA6A89|nr:thiamine diphosphokinase [Aquirufa aurantiipilula]MBZ1327173.1 thiamine diphosphokinase [Aquirufa aurantiipilula]